MDIHFGRGEAVLHVMNIPLFDAFTIPNSFMRMPSPVPALIDSLRIRWSGVTKTVHFRDATDKFVGEFKENSATIEVTATTPPNSCLGTNGFHFVSDSTTSSSFAQIGRERNGAFFNKEDDDEEEGENDGEGDD